MSQLDQQQAEDLIRERGEPQLVAQLDEGMLAPESLEPTVRKLLFAPIGWADPFRKVQPDAVRKTARQRGLLADGQNGFVEFSTVPADTLEPAEYAVLVGLRECLPEAEVQALWTVAECGDLQQRFPKARVVLTFGGRKFMREVDLQEIPCERCGKGPWAHWKARGGCVYYAGEKGERQRAARRGE